MGTIINTAAIVATDKYGQPLAAAHRDGTRWAIHLELEIGRGDRYREMERKVWKLIEASVTPAGKLSPVERTTNERGGLLLPHEVTEAQVRSALGKAAAAVDAMRGALERIDAETAERISRAIIEARSPELPLGS